VLPRSLRFPARAFAPGARAAALRPSPQTIERLRLIEERFDRFRRERRRAVERPLRIFEPALPEVEMPEPRNACGQSGLSLAAS